ncbi:MAG: leucyl aminopeptidase family protein [Micrococcales bacterium]|nr:leucyl aminopeptidase family protein [Micrococcales bacterium]MCL2668466.1 leucyl aminopeptidase family protein [Micrococcales bacterium]
MPTVPLTLVPEVTLAGGDVATTPLLVSGTVDALAVLVGPAAEGDDALTPGAGAAQAAALFGIDLAGMAERADMTGKAGEAHVVDLPQAVGSAVHLPWHGLPARLVLVGTGQGTPTELRRAGAALAGATKGLGQVVTTVATNAADSASRAAEVVRVFVEGYLLAAYPPFTVTDGPRKPAAALVLLGADGTRAETAVAAATTFARSTWLARDLTAAPASTKTPAWLAKQASRKARAAGLEVEVLKPRRLADEGFGALLAVGGGSPSGPRLVRVTSSPQVSEARHVVIVGKGITFDTGGLCLKPRESMVTMKTDMAGAAVALATVLGAGELGVPYRVTAVLACAENHMGAGSYRPGDVVTTHGGRTVEVINTDAEGRLVLADALDWAVTTLAPDVVVDVATLTGAAKDALGLSVGALLSDDDALADALVAAGDAAGEPVWRLPLVDEYEPDLDSTVADVRQVGHDRRAGAGTIMAALMLRRFVRPTTTPAAAAVPWAHLDIAGPARSTAARHEVCEGSTGFGVRLLLSWLSAPTLGV